MIFIKTLCGKCLKLKGNDIQLSTLVYLPVSIARLCDDKQNFDSFFLILRFLNCRDNVQI